MSRSLIKCNACQIIFLPLKLKMTFGRSKIMLENIMFSVITHSSFYCIPLEGYEPDIQNCNSVIREFIINKQTGEGALNTAFRNLQTSRQEQVRLFNESLFISHISFCFKCSLYYSVLSGNLKCTFYVNVGRKFLS